MTTAANITIKKNDGTTDIVWSLIAASGGDNSPAIWRSETVAAYPGQRPRFQFQARDNKDKTGRRVDITFVYPSVYTDTSSGTTKILAQEPITLSVLVPLNMSLTDSMEAASQFTALMRDPIIRGALFTGYAPT